MSFAGAFKRSNPVRLAPPSENFSEQEPFLFEVTLEIKEREEGKKEHEVSSEMLNGKCGRIIIKLLFKEILE